MKHFNITACFITVLIIFSLSTPVFAAGEFKRFREVVNFLKMKTSDIENDINNNRPFKNCEGMFSSINETVKLIFESCNYFQPEIYEEYMADIKILILCAKPGDAYEYAKKNRSKEDKYIQKLKRSGMEGYMSDWNAKALFEHLTRMAKADKVLKQRIFSAAEALNSNNIPEFKRRLNIAAQNDVFDQILYVSYIVISNADGSRLLGEQFALRTYEKIRDIIIETRDEASSYEEEIKTRSAQQKAARQQKMKEEHERKEKIRRREQRETERSQELDDLEKELGF